MSGGSGSLARTLTLFALVSVPALGFVACSTAPSNNVLVVTPPCGDPWCTHLANACANAYVDCPGAQNAVDVPAAAQSFCDEIAYAYRDAAPSALLAPTERFEQCTADAKGCAALKCAGTFIQTPTSEGIDANPPPGDAGAEGG